MKILFLSHKASRCGVHEFGLNAAQALKKSARYSFEYRECASSHEYLSAIHEIKPLAVIYNYYVVTMPWLTKKLMAKANLIHIGIMHEVTQEKADSANDRFFQYHIGADPTLILRNPIVFKTGRLIPGYESRDISQNIPVIGSFGFGLKGKGFEKILLTVQEEFDEAIVKFHIPFAQFGDNAGEQARKIADHCQSLIKKDGIKLELSHEFLSKEQILDFLAQNTINVFFYDKYKGRGISSVTDYALAVGRPIAITQSTMFRHLFSCEPSICIEDRSLKEIIRNGIKPLIPFREEWTEINLIWDYERIMDKILYQHQNRDKDHLNPSYKIKGLLQQFLGRQPLNPWVSSTKKGSAQTSLSLSQQMITSYKPVTLSEKISFNRILNEQARIQYKETIDKLFELNPEMMAHKIPEANVQQAFVFDTVHRFASKYVSPKILCVGSYMDTAVAGLKAIGYKIDEIDPILNYELNEFFHKPSTKLSSYDFVISTSVIEHVKDDETFLTQISKLLAPGGIAILTCDYKDQYKPGDPIPSVDFRFYTQNDFKKRLTPKLENCSLIGTPDWDCPNPDFIYGKYQYTFATLVFEKSKL